MGSFLKLFSILGLWLLVLLGGGCGDEDDFIAGATFDPCLSTIPVCQTAAGCSMGEGKYLEGDFPGYFNFIVTTPADTEIVVRLFFTELKHPGEDLEVIWYEPGCSDSFSYESQGRDIFSLAGGDQTLELSHKIRKAGDHLVDVYCDARVHYFTRVTLNTPFH